MQPPAFWSGSRITAATVSAPSNSIRSAIFSAAQSGSRPSGQWYSFVFGTWQPPGANGSNGVRRPVRPVAMSAPIVVPW